MSGNENYQDWQDVLVQWVNCLGLQGSTVTNIKELGDGRLFTSLLKTLTIEPECEVTTDKANENVAVFLKNEYPKFCMDTDPCEMEDEIGITYITSVLLFHSVVRCKNENLVSQMFSLNQDVQSYITHFLQSMLDEGDFTKTTLKTAIHSYKKSSPPRTPNQRYQFTVFSPSFKSPTNGPSLKEIYQSPLAQKTKELSERRLEIRRLNEELENEQKAKFELQDQLHKHQEKTKQLVLQLNEKNNEIKELRNYWMHCDCESQSKSLEELNVQERTLKKELKHLETYSSAVETELGTFRIDNEFLQQRLAKAEKQCALWQTKSEEYQSACQKLQYDIEEKEVELSRTKVLCSELQSHIEELRFHKQTSIEEDISQSWSPSSPVSIPENAADAVVEVQLREMVEENKELNHQIAALRLEEGAMTERIADLECRLEIACQEANSLKASKIELEKKVDMMISLQHDLEETKMKLNKATIELDHLYKEETLLQQQKEGLQDLLACKDLELLELKKSNESLSNNFADLQQRFEETQKILVTETERIVKLQREALEAQKVWQSLESVDEKLKEEVILVERILLLNETSDQAVTLQDCTPCSEDDQQEKGGEGSLSAVCLSVKAKVQKLNYLLTDLNANNVESLNVRTRLESTCQQLNEHIKKLQGEILELESKEQDQLIKNNQLRECLQKADKNIDSLQMKVSEYTDKIEKLSAILEDKKNIVEKLESIKKNLTAKICALEEENSSTKVKLQEIRCELTEVKEDKIQLEDVYNKLLKRSEEQAREVNRLNSVIEELDLQLKELKEEKDFSTCKIEEITKKLLEVQASKDSLEKMYSTAVKENELSMTQLKSQSEQLKNQIRELEERIKISDQELIVLNDNLEELNNEKEILKQQYNDEIQKKDEHNKLLSDKVGLLKTSISKLEEEKQTADSEYETLQIKLTGKLAQKDVEVEELNRSLIEKNEVIDKLQIKMQNEIKKLADEKEILSNTLESTKNKLVEVLVNKDQLESLFKEQKQDYSKELAIVTDKVSTLTRQLEEMLQEKEVMHAELEQKNCELMNIQGNYETLQEETKQLEVLTVQQREELKNCAAEIEDLIEKREFVVSELEVTKTELSKEKEHQNSLLEALSKKEKCLLSATEETEKLHTELTLIEEQRDSLQDAVQKLSSELDVAETTKAKLLESYNASKLENESIIKLKLELEEKVSLLENEKKSIHTALNVANSDLILHKQKQEETLTGHNREIAELKKEILKLTHKAMTLQQEIDALECDKKKLVLNLESGKSEVSELKSQNKHLCETNNKLKTENEELESLKLFLDDKIKQLVQDKSSVNEEIGYVKASLQALEENKDQLVKKYKKELDAKEEKINKLSKERDELQKSLEQTNEEKNILDRNLCLAKSELHEVTVTKDELLKAHAKQIQETEENIKNVHKNALEVKAMLLKKVEEVEEERNTEKKLRERVELLLHQEKSNMESVLAQRNALVSEKELILKFCADFRSNICSLRETIAALEDRTKQTVKCEVDSMQNANDSPESEDSVTDSLHVLYDRKKKLPSKPWNLEHYETVNFPNCNLSSKSSERDSNWSDSTASQNSGLLKQTVTLEAEETEKEISTSETNSEEDSDAKWSEVVKKLKELKTDLNAARDEVIGVLKSNDILRTKLSITEKRCTDIAQKYSNMALNNDILKSENEKLLKGIEGLSNLKTLLEESEKDLADECRLKAEIKSELEDLELSYTTLKTDFDKQTATNISLNTAVKDMNDKMNILYEQNKDLSQKVKEYEQCQLKIEETSLKLKRIQQMSDLELENVFGSLQALRQMTFNFQKSLKNVSNKFECLVLECTINCDELQEIEKHKNSLENLYLLLQIECDVLSQDVLKFTYTCLKETKPDKVLESTEFGQNIELREQQIKDLEFQIGALISGIEVAMMECSRVETKCDMLKDLQLTQPTEMQDLATLTSGDRIDLIKNILSRLEILSEKTQSEQDMEEDCWNPEDSLEMQETAQMKESKHSALLKLRFQLGEIKALQEQNNALSTKLFSEQNTKQQLSKCLADIRETNEKLVSENNILSKLKNLAEEKLSKQFQETNELKQAFETLLEDNYKLKSEIDERKNKLIRMEAQMEEKIKAVRQEYEMKLDRLKAKMRVLYDEEIEKKMKKSREESEQLQTLCKDYKDKIKSCHEEINFQRSHIWELMDKLVLSENEKKQLNEEILKLKGPLFECLDSGRPTDRKTRTCSREINTMDVIDESVTYVRRRKSIQQNIPSGMGLMFDPEDEEGEVFNTTNLADLKAGRCIPADQDSNYKGRISELQYRNSLCPPHLKSSYPAETQFHDPRVYRDEDLKLGCAMDVENLDTQSTSMLLPGERPRKKDRGQGNVPVEETVAVRWNTRIHHLQLGYRSPDTKGSTPGEQ